MKLTYAIIIVISILSICTTILLIVFSDSIIDKQTIEIQTPPLYLPALTIHPANVGYGEIPITTQDYQTQIEDNQSDIINLQIDIDGTQSEIDAIIQAINDIEEELE